MKGERLAELRKDKGWSQETFAKMFDVSLNTVGNWERNINSPDDEIKCKLAEIFNISLDYLMGTTSMERPLHDERMIYLPKDAPPEMREDVLRYIDLLTLEYKQK